MIRKADLESIVKDELADLEWAQKKLNNAIQKSTALNKYFAGTPSINRVNDACLKVLKERLQTEGYDYCTEMVQLSPEEQKVLLEEEGWVTIRSTFLIVKLKPVHHMSAGFRSGSQINVKLMKELCGKESLNARDFAQFVECTVNDSLKGFMECTGNSPIKGRKLFQEDIADASGENTHEKKTMTENDLKEVICMCETMFFDYVSVDRDSLTVKDC